MPKIVGIALLLGLMGSRAVAQVPNSGNVFVGYSFENANSSALNQNLGRFNLQGWEAAVEGKVFGPVGIVADFSGHYGSLSNDVLPPEGPGPIPGPVIATFTGHEEDFLFGPRFSVRVGQIRLFAESEFGLAHMNTNSSGSANSFATAEGGGVDFSLSRAVALRVAVDGVFTRLYGSSQSNLRVSTGIVFRF